MNSSTLRNYVRLSDFFANLVTDDLLALNRIVFRELVEMNHEKDFPLTTAAFERLNEKDVNEIEEKISVCFGREIFAEICAWRENNFPHYRREFLRYACAVAPELMAKKTNDVQE